MITGYGIVPWGVGPWGAGIYATPTGTGPALPRSKVWDTFDLSGVVQPNDLERVLTFFSVSTAGNGASFFDGSFNVASGGVYPAQTAALIFSVAISVSFTIQYDLTFEALPVDFSGVSQGNPSGNHVYLGAWGTQEFAVGFFVSQEGWAYTGEVTLDSSGNVVPAQPVVPIAGSSNWTQVGVEYIIRIVLNADEQLVYLFITPAVNIASGQQLQDVLVAIRTATDTPDAVFISVLGDSFHASWMELFNYQASSKTLLPTAPPVAQAGNDQTTLLCSVIQLDGSQSVDPQGLPITYQWRLIGAPPTSMFLSSCGDGTTLEESPPTGFTDTLYSEELQALDVEEPVQIGDVIALGNPLTNVNGYYSIIAVNRTSPFSVQLEYQQLIQDQTGIQFKLLRQNGINGATLVNPTFYPDVLAFFTFDLRVNNGIFSSSPLGTDRSQVLINVLESALPRGCSVDASFIYDYLLSAWKLVEDADRIAVFWEALARVAATELYTLWQVEYSKSLTDIQRTFIRRWLHYDTLLPEPSPELTTTRFIWGGVLSNPILGSISGVAGSTFVVSSPFLASTVSVPLVSPGVITPAVYAQEIQARFSELLGPSATATVWWTRAGVLSEPVAPTLTVQSAVEGRTLIVSVDGGVFVTATAGADTTYQELADDLNSQLPTASISFTDSLQLRVGSPTVAATSAIAIDPSSTLLVANGGPLTFISLTASSAAYIHLFSNIPFTLTAYSTAPYFTYPCANTVPGGITGTYINDYTFRTSVSLSDLALQQDDLLVIAGNAYRIVGPVDDPSDTFQYQRLVLKDPIPATSAGGAPWVIPGWVTSTFLNFWSGLVSLGDPVDFEVLVTVNGQTSVSLASTTAFGANETLVGKLAVDTGVLSAQLSLQPGTIVRLARVIRRRYIPIDVTVVDIPILTDVIEITDTDAVLQRNIDYFIGTVRGQNAIQFVSGLTGDAGDVFEGQRPPNRLWAEYTFLDNSQLVEDNFGAAINVTQDMLPATVDYLSAVRGCWYARYNGPTVYDLRIAIQIFMGLPFAEEAGTIIQIRTDFFTQTSLILIQDTANAELVRSYTYPRVLDLETNPATNATYQVGDTVAQFAPLVMGAEVVDWVSNPTWFAGMLQQGVFYEVQKYHTFYVRINSTAFNAESIDFAQQFISTIQPKYTNPLYAVALTAGGPTGVDDIQVTDDLSMAVTLSLYDQPCDGFGGSYFVDEPWAAGSVDADAAWRHRVDTVDDPAIAPPVYPGPSQVTIWGIDKEWLCPLDQLTASQCITFVPEFVPIDSIFTVDTPLASQEAVTISSPSAYPYTLSVFTAAATGTIQSFSVQLAGSTQGSSTLTVADWTVSILVNATVVASLPFTIGFVHAVLGLIITMPRDLDLVSGALDIPLNLGDVVTLSITPAGSVEQSPGWTELTASVSLGATLWSVDVPLSTATYCAIQKLV